MVEIDGEVIRLSKEFLPGIAGGAWNDPRAEVIVGDGIDYVKRAPDAAFDVIIVDSAPIRSAWARCCSPTISTPIARAF